MAFLGCVHNVADQIPLERVVPSRPSDHLAAALPMPPQRLGDALIERTPCLPLPLSGSLSSPAGGEPKPLPPSCARRSPKWSPPSVPERAGGVSSEAPSSSDEDDL